MELRSSAALRWSVLMGRSFRAEAKATGVMGSVWDDIFAVDCFDYAGYVQVWIEIVCQC